MKLDVRFDGTNAGLFLSDKSPSPRAGFELDATFGAHVFVQDLSGKARGEIVAPGDQAPALNLKDKTGRRLPLK